MSTKGDPNIGNRRMDLRDEHIQDVYNAVYWWKRKVKLIEIWKVLEGQTREDNNKVAEEARFRRENGHSEDQIKNYIRRKKKKTISERTIQRCIERDPRISRDGWSYFIDDQARFEKRYLSPSLFGQVLFQSLFGGDIIAPFKSTPDGLSSFQEGSSKTELLELLESDVEEMIKRFGALILFILIEATKPFKDKSMTQIDRNDLVRYWVRNAIPMEGLLGQFQKTSHTFEWAFDRVANKPSDGYRPVLETKESMIKKVYSILKKNHPEMYEELNQATKWASSNTREISYTKS